MVICVTLGLLPLVGILALAEPHFRQNNNKETNKELFGQTSRRVVSKLESSNGKYGSVGMSLPVCRSCGSDEFRISHLRRTDLSKLLTLRYPIRCKICKERDFTFLGTALSLRHKRRKKNDVIAQNGHA